MKDGQISQGRGPLGIVALTGLLLLMIVAAYSNTLNSPPVLDDFHSIVDEPILRVQNWSLDAFINLGKTKFSVYRYIPNITFAWDLWVGNGQLFYLHTTNLIIHCLCFLISILFIYQICAASKNSGEECPGFFRSTESAILVAALWALNPVQTNAVTYMVQRMTSLCTLFFLLSLTCYVLGRRRFSANGRRDLQTTLLWLCAAVATGLAFFSKENSAMIPVAMVFTEWWFFQPDLPRRLFGFCRRHWICASIGVFVCTPVFYKLFVGQLAGFAGRHFTALERLMTEARIVVWYISVLLWPDPGRLSLEHHVELSTSLFQPATTILSIVFIFALAFWTLWRRQKYPLITYGLMWFMLNLVIESSIVPLELLFEHRMYLPSLGLFLALIGGLQLLLPRVTSGLKRTDAVRMSWCLMALVASVLSLATFSRNEVWRDPVSLSADDAAKHPNSPRARANYAVALSRVDRCDEAIVEAQTAMSLSRTHYEVYGVAANTRFICYQKAGQHNRILEEALGVLEAWPKDADVYAKPSVWLLLASAQQERGDLESAYGSYRDALKLHFMMSLHIPDFEKLCADKLAHLFKLAREKGLSLPGMDLAEEKGVGGRFWSALQLLETGYLAAGEQILREASNIDAAHAAASQEILGKTEDYGKRNLVQASKWSFAQKYVRNPFSRFNASMAIAYLVREHKLPSPFVRLGEYCLDYALILQPASSDAHLLKGWYHFERNQVQEALSAANRAIELEPDYAKAWMGLGFFLTKGPRPVEAISAFSTALDLYPGYPQRSTIVGIINSLRDNA